MQSWRKFIHMISSPTKQTKSGYYILKVVFQVTFNSGLLRTNCQRLRKASYCVKANRTLSLISNPVSKSANLENLTLCINQQNWSLPLIFQITSINPWMQKTWLKNHVKLFSWFIYVKTIDLNIECNFLITNLKIVWNDLMIYVNVRFIL